MSWQFPKVKASLKALGLVLLPGSAAVLLSMLLLRLGAWIPLEQKSYELLFRLRGPIPWDHRVAIVGIDDKTLQALGQFPIDRRYYAQLIDRIAPESSLVVLDVVFADPSTDDSVLAEAIARHNTVVLSSSWSSTGKFLPPLPRLEEGAIATGHILNRPDSDGITRQVMPLENGVPTLSLASLEAYHLIRDPIALPDLETPLWLNWQGPAQDAPQYSMVDVLQGRVPAQTFRDRIVLVGSTVSGLDTVFTPFDRSPPTTGVYLHATLMSNLLQQKTLSVPHGGWLILLMVLAGPSFGAVLSRHRCYQRFLWLIGLWLVWGVVAVLSFCLGGYWLPVALPFGLMGITLGLVEVQERLQLHELVKQKLAQIRRLQSRHALLNSDLVPLHASLSSSPESTHSQWGDVEDLSRMTLSYLTEMAEKFAQSQAAHAAIAQNLSLGILTTNQQGRVWYFNPLIVDWLPVRVGDRLEKYLVPQWLSEADWQAACSFLYDEECLSREVRQGDRWFELKLEPLFQVTQLNNFSTPNGLMLTLEDITTRKQTEGEIHRNLEQEREMNHLKTRFISMISHELRTPLTIIQSTTDLLEYYDWSETDKQERFQQIREAVHHMTELLEDVLLIGKTESRSVQLKPQCIQVTDFCQGLVNTFQATTGRSRRLNFFERGTPQDAWLDAKLLRQILSNLLSNAIKYSHEGSTITLELVYQPENLMVRVKDQGIGIPQTEQQKLFQAFYRATNAEQIQGTGLGLVIVKRCIDLLQGQITVDSEVDLGTTFTVHLPLKLCEQP